MAGCGNRALGLESQVVVASGDRNGSSVCEEAAEEEAIRVFAVICAICCWPRQPGPTDLGAGSRTAHRRQGGGGGRHWQVGGYRDHLSHARAQAVGRKSARAGRTVPPASCGVAQYRPTAPPRETDRLATELMQRHPELRLQSWWCRKPALRSIPPMELAARELVDVSLRGAVSIARRLQRPVGRAGQIETESHWRWPVSRRWTNSVGTDPGCGGRRLCQCGRVDVNTASVPLLARVAGLNATLARNIVEHRDANSPFRRREQLLNISAWAKTFEQAADSCVFSMATTHWIVSAVHPEAYPLVERILAGGSVVCTKVLGQHRLSQTLEPTRFTDERFGVPTVRDILAELEKAGRDPRPEFNRPPRFRRAWRNWPIYSQGDGAGGW